MDEKIKAEWFERLKNNRQGMGRLRSGDEGCCWGWLCDVAVANGVMTQGQILDGVYSYKWKQDDQPFVTSYPPEKILEWADIPWMVNGSDSTVHLLAGMNDNGSNFQAIMSIIEELL